MAFVLFLRPHYHHPSIIQVMTQEWYQTFASEEQNGMTRDMLADVLSAANYMAIPPLLDLMCLKVPILYFICV